MGHEVIDHGDLQFESVPNDTPSNNIKQPRTIGAAAKKVKSVNIKEKERVKKKLSLIQLNTIKRRF